MVLKCCVPGCRSNYEKPYISVFRFPNEENLRKKWLLKIRRENYNVTKYSCVCIKHFPKEFIITEDVVAGSDGKSLSFKRERLKLTPGAYPTIVGDIAPHLEEKLPKKRRTWDDREDEQLQLCLERSLATYEDEVQAASVSSLWDVTSHLQSRAIPSVCYLYLGENLTLLKVTNDGVPSIGSSVVIEPRLCFSVYTEKEKLSPNHLSQVGVDFETITTKHNVDFLIDILEKIAICSPISNLDLAVENLSVYKTQLDASKVKKIEFFVEQLQAIESKQLQYSSDTFVFAFKTYLSSLSTYSIIRDAKILTLPHPRTLQRVIQKLNVMNDSYDVNSEYLRKRISFLNEREKVISLLIDEIYLDDSITFKGGKITGMSVDSCDPAKTAHVFLASAVFCSYRDVIAIAPVSTFTSEQLFAYTVKVVKSLSNLGFRVICIITDNNAVNSSMFRQFSAHPLAKSAVINPSDGKSPMFLLFDSVHILKCVRNNWINLKDGKCLNYPDMENDDVVRSANFSHLRLLYNIEKDCLLRYAKDLSLKSLYPSSIERQKMSLALKVFNKNNVVALELLGPKHASLKQWEDTAKFIEIISQCFTIMNVKTPMKGVRKRDENSYPIQCADQVQLAYLMKVHNWLQKWESLSHGNVYNGLSKPTFRSFSQTCLAMYNMVIYLLETYNPEYVLLGKFQTDPLEKRFGCYRQLSGSNYHISLQQLLESEKKIRVKNLIKLSSKKHITLNELTIEDSLQLGEGEISCEVEEAFVPIGVVEIDFSIPDDAGPIILFISGYAAHSISKKLTCKDCVSLVISKDTIEFELEKHISYIEACNRGGLKKPTMFCVQIAIVCYRVFGLITEKYEREFLQCRRQVPLLMNLCYQHICNKRICEHDICLTCEYSQLELAKKLIRPICNIFVNNYVKKKNDCLKKQCSKNKGKINKFN